MVRLSLLRVSALGLAAVVAVSVLNVTAATDAAAFSKAVTAKCKADYKRLCPAYKVDSDGLRACMRSNHRAISNKCMEALIDAGEAPASARRR
ncbi:MAG: hypothetical protein ACOYLQ_19020 [Hyphomicrobiaceae bacterium]